MIETLSLIVAVRDDGREVRESLLVDNLGHGRYKLVRSPGFALNLAAGDVFELHPDDRATKVISRGGNLCVQVFRMEDLDEVERFLVPRFEAIGGFLDGKEKRVLVFTIPVSVGFPAVDKILKEVEQSFSDCDAVYGNVYDNDGVTPLNWWKT